MKFPWPELEPASAVAEGSLHRLTTSIAIAQGLAATGRAIDLGGLEAFTGLLCAQVMDLSPSEGSAIKPALLALEGSIARLMASLRTMTR